MAPLPLANLWKNRNLIVYFSYTNLKIRFKGTYLGLLWAGLEPLLTFLLLYAVFTTIRIGRGEDFAIYLLTGVLFYHIFTRGTLLGMGSLRNNKGILQSLNIRREFFPVVSVGTVTIMVLVEIVVLLGLMPVFQFTPGWTLLLIPIPIVLLLMLILGFSYILSIINVFSRDIQWTWPILTHAVFFVTPIFWYLENVPASILLEIHKINPMGQIIEIAHKLVVFQEIPPLNDWLYATLFSVAILFIGYAVFQRYEYRVVEEL